MSIRDYAAICRPDHWIKNVFVVPGILLYVFFHRHVAEQAGSGLTALLGAGRIALGMASVFMVASANYVFNEILDADSDRFHPDKRHRPIPSGRIRLPIAYALWATLSVLGIGAAFWDGNIGLGATATGLWLAGIAYNLSPIRLKDRMYMDVISESLNNPLRLMAGWFMAGPLPGLPPLSVVMAYWMFGAYLMAIKRYAEYRFIDDPIAAGRYRRSFVGYNAERLQESILFYGAAFAFFSGVFIARYRIELVLAIPLVTYCLAYYFHLGFRADSPVQRPESLYRESKLMVLVGATFLCCALLLLQDIPFMRTAFQPRVPVPMAVE